MRPALLVAMAIASSSTMLAEKYHAYVGTYTDGDSEGIYRFAFDTENPTAPISEPELAAETENPSFLALHPSGKFLYAVNETNTGEISAFAVDAKSGKLTFLNQKPTGGGAPCHLVVSKDGGTVLVANYSGGSVCAIRIGEDGKLGERSAFIQHEGSSVTSRQKNPHAHSINLDAANQFAFAADLGTDKIYIYKFDTATGELSPHGAADVKPGSGPRHFAFLPDGKFGYAISELANTVTAFAYDSAKGALDEIQNISTLPEGLEGTSHTAEIVAHPNGKFLYGSNRGHDSIAAFTIDQASGKLTFVEAEKIGGKSPRNFVIDPSGTLLFAGNQGSDKITTFRIDPETGALAPTRIVIKVAKPVCIRFLKAAE